MPLNDSVGPNLVALRGVVVHHVQDHLDAGIVQARHHLLELGEHERGNRRIARIGGEETDAVVAPVVGQPLVQQMLVVDEGVHRHQFHRGDAKRGDVVHDFLAPERGEGAAQRLGHHGMQPGEAAHVRFVEDGAVPRHLRRAFAAPGEGRIDHPAFRHERRAVALVETHVAVIVPDGVAETGRVPAQLPDMRLGVRDRAPACWD